MYIYIYMYVYIKLYFMWENVYYRPEVRSQQQESVKKLGELQYEI